MHAQLGKSIDIVTCAGKLLTCQVDLLMLQSSIASDAEATGVGDDADSLAVAATTAMLALTSNDMVPGMMGGMTGAHIYDSFRTKQLHDLAARFQCPISPLSPCLPLQTGQKRFPLDNSSHCAPLTFYPCMSAR